MPSIIRSASHVRASGTSRSAKPDGGLLCRGVDRATTASSATRRCCTTSHPPTTVSPGDARADATAARSGTRRELRHRHFRTARVPVGGSPTLDRTPLLFNDEVVDRYVVPDRVDAHFYRNAQADEIVYVSEGRGVLRVAVRRPVVSRAATTSSSPAASSTARVRAGVGPAGCW